MILCMYFEYKNNKWKKIYGIYFSAIGLIILIWLSLLCSFSSKQHNFLLNYNWEIYIVYMYPIANRLSDSEHLCWFHNYWRFLSYFMRTPRDTPKEKRFGWNWGKFNIQGFPNTYILNCSHLFYVVGFFSLFSDKVLLTKENFEILYIVTYKIWSMSSPIAIGREALHFPWAKE